MPRQNKTPTDRSAVIERANAKARKGYKTNTKKRVVRNENEVVVITDMLVSLKLVGYTNTQCAAIVGISKGQVKEISSQTAFQSRLEKLQTKLPEAALTLGRAYLIEAVQAVLHVMRTADDGSLVLKAAAEMFDRFGIPKVSRTESKIETPDEGSGDEIPKTVLEKLRTATPEVQEQVASLQESFLEGVERILTGGDNGHSDED